jgi:hypothetical protein
MGESPRGFPDKLPTYEGLFTYHPLETSTREIRVLQIDPATDLTAPIHCNLVHLSLDAQTSNHAADERPFRHQRSDKNEIFENASGGFAALSYFWGDVEPAQTIYMNGLSRTITPNLAAALRHLRDPHDFLRIWIDALCINQADLVERAQQVSQMGDIYRQAERVLVWLGPEAEDSHLVFPLSDHIARYALKLTSEPTGQAMLSELKLDWLKGSVTEGLASMRKRGMQGTDHHPGRVETDNSPPMKQIKIGGSTFGYGKPPPPKTTVDFGYQVEETNEYAMIGELSHTQYKAILQLLKRPWWARSWIVQELCLARKTTLVCGSHHVEWDTFSVAALLILGSDNSAGSVPTLPSAGYAASLLRIVGILNHSKNNLDLLDLLWEFRSLGASDKRDKVFAFLGLLPSSDPAHQHIRPQYEVDFVRCYTDTARACLQLRGNLDCLTTERFTSSSDASVLPSWVPDWSYAKPDIIALPRQVSGLDGSNSRIFAASGTHSSYEPEVEYSPNSAALLLLSGFVVDQLTDVEIPFPSKIDETAIVTFMDESMSSLDMGRTVLDRIGRYFLAFHRWKRFTMSTHSATTYPGVDPLQVLCATMCAGNLPMGLEFAFAVFKHWQEIEFKWPERLAGMGKLGRGLSPKKWYHSLVGLSGLTQYQYDEAAVQSFWDPVRVSTSRRLARTEKGYLALVPHSSQPGDRIALCRGGKLPLVLRASLKDTWELVGCSYVHGIMHGEAWDVTRCNKLRIS